MGGCVSICCGARSLLPPAHWLQARLEHWCPQPAATPCRGPAQRWRLAAHAPPCPAQRWRPAAHALPWPRTALAASGTRPAVAPHPLLTCAGACTATGGGRGRRVSLLTVSCLGGRSLTAPRWWRRQAAAARSSPCIARPSAHDGRPPAAAVSGQPGAATGLALGRPPDSRAPAPLASRPRSRRGWKHRLRALRGGRVGGGPHYPHRARMWRYYERQCPKHASARSLLAVGKPAAAATHALQGPLPGVTRRWPTAAQLRLADSLRQPAVSCLVALGSGGSHHPARWPLPSLSPPPPPQPPPVPVRCMLSRSAAWLVCRV